MIETDRLVLRTWRDEDIDALHLISNDPEVMEYFPRCPTWGEVADLVVRHRANLAWGKPGLWAVELKDEPGVLQGFVGLAKPRFEADFTPCVEVGWRLRRSAWGHGYATEAARASLHHGFRILGLTDVVSFTAVGNQRSRAVMEHLVMTHDPAEDFDHPGVPEGHPLRRHVLYRLRAEDSGL